nr:hypothetical protein [Tanacetum cinerariifolium]
LKHPPSLDYVPGPEHPPSPIKIPYVPESEYPEYLVPSDAEAPLEDQPLSVDASPTAASPGYVVDSNLDEDLEEDPEDDHADYPADGGDGDDDLFDVDDDDDTDNEDEENFEDQEEKEHWLRPTLLLARKTVRLEPPMLASMEACIARHVALLSPPLPVYSLPLPLPSPLTTSLTDTGAPLGYRASRIRMRALFPSTSRMTDIPEANVPPRKRACLTTPAPRFEVKESSAVGVARQLGPTESDLRRCRVEPTDRPDHHRIAMLFDREAMYAHETWAGSEDRSAAITALKMAPKKRTTRATPATTTTPTTIVTDAQLRAIIDRGCASGAPSEEHLPELIQEVDVGASVVIIVDVVGIGGGVDCRDVGMNG